MTFFIWSCNDLLDCHDVTLGNGNRYIANDKFARKMMQYVIMTQNDELKGV